MRLLDGFASGRGLRLLFLLLLGLSASAVPLQAQTISSSANQTFGVGDPPTASATITVTAGAGTPVTAAKDIRIRIPSTFNMSWRTTLTSVTIGGGAAAKVSATLLPYEDGGKTVVVDVTSDFVSGNQITITGLQFTDFAAPSAAANLELELGNDGVLTATDNRTITITAGATPKILSAANQIFAVGGPATAISPITVTDAAIPQITAAAATGDIRIRIPASFNMSWNTSDTTAVIGGPAAAKVSTTVSYEDAGKTLVLNVTSNFAAGDSIVVSGLSFTSFTAVSAADSLQLEVKNDNVVTDVDARTITIATSLATISSSGNQTFSMGAAPTAAATITVTDNAVSPTITAVNDIRIRIPAGFNMTWRTALTTVTVGGSAAGKVSIALLPYEDAGKTVVLDVTTDFAPGDQITIAGLQFTSFLLPSPADNLELEVANDGLVTASDDKTITIVGPASPAISSAANQSFLVGGPLTPISTITIFDAATPQITAAAATGDIRIRIPATFNMTWDTTDTTAVIGGPAAAKVSATLLPYEDGGKTLVLNVTTNFAPGDYITVSGLGFTSFTAPSAPANLELELLNNNAVTATDDKTITIGSASISSAANQIFTAGNPITAISTITVTDAAVPSITAAAATGDIRIRIPATFNMTWDTTDTTAVIAGPAAAKVSTTVTYEDAGKTLVLNVTANFAGGDSITVSGLSFTNFTAASPVASLELEVKNDNLLTSLDDKTIVINDALASVSSAANQTFTVGSPAVAMSTITVTSGSGAQLITAAAATGDIRIRIPATFPMTWNTALTVATIGGGAAAKVSTTVTYEDAGKTLVLNVTSDFLPQQQITVSGLQFMSFTTGNPASNLELELRNDGALTALDNRTITILAPLTISSAANQIFTTGQVPTAAAVITITDDTVTPVIKSSTSTGDLRIHIPAGFNMTWDTSVTTITLGGSASGRVSTTLSAYEDGGQTAVVNVTSNFVAGDQITVTGLRFMSFAAPSPAANLQLEVANDGVISATDNRTITINAGATPTITSANNQIFTAGNPPTPAALITVSDAAVAQIRSTPANGDIRIRIPATFNMTWDTTVTTAVIGGLAAAKVSTTLLAYEDAGKTLVLNVTSNFANGDWITISGLSFTAFAASAIDNLELEVANDNVVTDVDDKTIIISSALAISSAANQIFTVGQAPTAAAVITITDDSVTPRITSSTSTGDLRIRIPATFNMTWDTSVTTITLGGTAAGKVSTTLSAYEDGGRTAVVNVTSNFVAGDQITVTGLRFIAFAAPSPVDNLALEVANDGVISATDNRTIIINPGGAPTITSASNQTFIAGDPTTAIATITVTDAPVPQITAAAATGDIRIRIPAGFNMSWDISDTTAVIGGPAAAKVSTTVTYEDAGKTLVLNVTANFAANDSITVSGLSFTGFTAASAADKLLLEVKNDNLVTDIDDLTITVTAAPATLASAAAQTFYPGIPPVAMSLLTVTAGSDTQTITAAAATGDIRIRIPAGYPMTWDTSLTTATIGGAAAGKVSTTVTYEDAGQTLVLDVTSDFLPQEQITVTGLAFANFTAVAATTRLELEVRNSGALVSTDSQTKRIRGAPTISSAVNQSFLLGAAPTASPTITITDDATSARITAGNDIRIRIPASFPMTWDTSVLTVTIGGAGGPGRLSATLLPYEDGGKTAVVNVTTSFATGNQRTIDGLQFMNFTALAAPDNLELEVDNNGVLCSFDDKTKWITAATISSASDQSFSVGAAPTASAIITITDNSVAPAIKAGANLRIRIPAGFNMTWRSDLTSVTLGGSAAGKVSATLLPYEDGQQTVVLDVLTDFALGDQVTIVGLQFANFVAPSAVDNLELEVANDGVVTADDDKTIVINPGATPNISSAADQLFSVGGAATPISPITITDAGPPQITAAVATGDIRIHIPVGFNMTWDVTDTTAVITGLAAAKVSPTVTYEDAGQTVVLNVTTNFASGDSVTVSGLSFMNFTAPSAASNLWLEVKNDNVVTDTDTRTITVANPAVLISSAGNQSFTVGNPPVPNALITVTDHAFVPTITAAKDLRVRIPSTFNMTWRTTLTTVTLGGSAAGKVSPTLLPYEDGGKTLVLDVMSNFAAGDTLTLDGLQFANFSAPSGADNLELEVNNDNVVTATDDKLISILPASGATLSSSRDQAFAVGDPATAIAAITVTDGAVPTITAAAATGDIRIRIPATFNMRWDTTDTTAVIAGPAAAKVSTTVTYEDAGKTVVLNVTSNFVANDSITVSGLSFANFTAASAVANLELEVKNDGLITDLDDKTIQIVQVTYRSIGTNAANLYAGNASVAAGSLTVTFASALPANVGLGDRLVIGAETLYIRSRDSSTQVTLQSPATVLHSSQASTIARDFGGAASLQNWETARQGDLVATGRREVGVVYNDGVFTQPITIDGSTTDATHYMTLVVADSQRHNGTAGTGVVFDGLAAGVSGMIVRDDYTVVDGLELTGNRGANGVASVKVEFASNVLLDRLLIHNFADAAFDVTGVLGGQSSNFTIRSSIIYDGDTAGIRTTFANSTATIQNVTVYAMAQRGVYEDQGTFTVTNTISMGNPTADFTLVKGTQAYDMSQDATANCGASCRPGELPAAQFIDVPGRNLHLLNSAPARSRGTSLLALFRTDIDGQTRLIPWDMGADEIELTTAVTLQSFTASATDGAVDLTWTTASELQNLGFHLYRSLSADGPYERITSSLIPGLGSSPTGASYSYRDGGLVNGQTYFYELEDVETTGKTQRHGPVLATPTAGANGGGGSGDSSGSGGAGDGSSGGTSGKTYGDPGAPSLRILERGSSYVLLELRTPGFVAVDDADGTVHLEIPSFELPQSPGSPAVPVRRAFVDAPAGRGAHIASVQTEDLVGFAGLRVGTEGASEVVVTNEGMVRPGLAPRKPARGSDRRGYYPRVYARLLGTVFQGETKKARLELSPLRYNPGTRQLVLARRLLVRVEFAGVDPREKSLGGVLGRRPPVRVIRGKGVVAQLVTKEAGLYKVPFESIFGTSPRGVPVASLRLSRHGETVPYHLEPERALFGPGAFLYFVGGGDLNPNGDMVYELERGRVGTRMSTVSAIPSGSDVSTYETTRSFEENHYYQAGLLDAPDLWLWELMVSPVSKSHGFTLSDVDTGSTGHLKVWLQGASDFEADPDHHVRVSVNGSFISEALWDGKREQVIEGDLAPGILQDGANTLTLENVGDTAAAYSMVFLNRFEVTEPRNVVAEGGKIDGRFTQSGSAAIAGLPAGSLVLDTTASPKWLKGATAGAGVFRFRAEAGRRYLAVDPTATLSPEVRRFVANGLRTTAHQADWLLLAPREFLSAAQALVDLRREQGLVAKTVALEDVYEEFGFGETGPGAIRAFLEYAWRSWKRPSPKYVVLLGDSTYDPKDYLGTHVADRLPFYPLKTSFLWTASDPVYAAVNGDDLVPDLAIGRLPAGSIGEAESLVAKVVAFERAGQTLEGKAVLVADNADIAGEFEADADDLAATVLQGRDVQKIYLRDLGPGGTRAEIEGAFDSGSSLLSYIGHGGTAVWASENVFNNTDVSALGAQSQQPLLMTMNCLNGFFHFPPLNSLAEALLKADGKGAIAAFSPSGLSLNDAAHVYHKAVLAEITSGHHSRLGDALLAAQSDYADTGAFPELLSIYHLFGDPAMKIR